MKYRTFTTVAATTNTTSQLSAYKYYVNKIGEDRIRKIVRGHNPYIRPTWTWFDDTAIPPKTSRVTKEHEEALL